MMLPNTPRRLSLDPYSLLASLLLLLTLLLASWFVSRHWLGLRIEQQLQELTVQSHDVINAANKELVQGSAHITSITHTLAGMSSMQRFLLTPRGRPNLQTDLDEFHQRFQLIGVWLLDKKGKTLLQSAGSTPLNQQQSTQVTQVRASPHLVFDLELQQAKNYYAHSITPNGNLTLLVGNTIAAISHNANRINLLVSGSSNLILLSDDSRWLGYKIPEGGIDPEMTGDSLALPLHTNLVQPEILLLGDDQAPVLFVSQTSTKKGVQIHVLADASQIYYQASVKNKLAAVMAFTITGSVWGGLLSWLTFRRGRQHQQLMDSAHQELLRLNSQLTHLATTDPLTQSPNRRAADTRLRHELAKLQRYQHPFCVVMLDIDFFKLINDEHGHDVGDQVLCHFAVTGRETIRTTDVLARIGGEEFLLILPETNQEQGLLLAQRLLDTMAASPLYLKDKTIKFTFSGGLAEAQSTDDIHQLLLRADDSLYVAKSQGRCRIIGDQPVEEKQALLG
ncbi:GGDEF domain-containing protein [Oceanisphaera sp. IT1-181]|uniref:GGDEF domain-containing protein n=1 Tax=Oceanisphaera sp. IT1-181 TaxID=3081199 RepID=UPI0029CA8B7F|nr:GGDEF domain-containing protein [Oceanisphaera sp. IT1-181]